MIKRNIGIFLVLTITLLIYLPSLFYHFVGDDYSALLKFVTAPDSQKAFEYRWPPKLGGYFRPLNWLPFILGHSISGIPLPPSPYWQDNSFLIPYHILHLLFHLMNVFLIYFIAYFIFKTKLYAALSAFIFAVHPVNSEVICWVSAFADIAMVFFLLLSIILFAGFFLTKKRTAAILFYSGSLLSFMLALLTKETALCFPFLIILITYFLKQQNNLFGAGKKKLSWLGYFLIMAFYFILRKSLLPIEGLYWQELFTGILERRVFKLAYYLRDLIFPIDLSFLKQIAYQYSLRPVFIIIGIFLPGLFLFISIFRWRKDPLFMLCLGFIAAALFLPTLGLFAAGRRHVYFPVAAYSIFLVSFISRLRKKYIIIILISLFISLEIYTSLKRNYLFQFNGQLVQEGLFELQKELSTVDPDSIIYLVGIPGVARNTPAFYALPEDKIKFIYQDKNLTVHCLSFITFTPPLRAGAGFTQNGVKESNINFLDNFTLVESMQTGLENFISVQEGERSAQFKILERDKFGHVAKVMFRISPQVLKNKKVYFVGFKAGKMQVLKSF